MYTEQLGYSSVSGWCTHSVWTSSSYCHTLHVDLVIILLHVINITWNIHLKDANDTVESVNQTYWGCDQRDANLWGACQCARPSDERSLVGTSSWKNWRFSNWKRSEFGTTNALLCSVPVKDHTIGPKIAGTIQLVPKPWKRVIIISRRRRHDQQLCHFSVCSYSTTVSVRPTAAPLNGGRHKATGMTITWEPSLPPHSTDSLTTLTWHRHSFPCSFIELKRASSVIPWFCLLVRKVLAVTVTSVASEHMFSVTGSIMYQKRTSWTCNYLEELTYLYDSEV